MNSSKDIPKIGARFFYKDTECEISFSTKSAIRYAAVFGGSIHYMPTMDFFKLVESHDISYTENIIKLFKENTTYPNIRDIELYIKSALTLDKPCSQKKLRTIIKEVNDFFPEIYKPAPSTLARWIKIYRMNNMTFECFLQKSKGNYHFRFDIIIEEIILEEIENIYLDEEYRTASDVYASIKKKIIGYDPLLEPPSLRTIQRRIKAIDPHFLMKKKQGFHIANKNFMAAGRGYVSLNFLNIIEIDTNYVDCLIVDSITGAILGRPILCAAIDVFTRVIVGWNLSFQAVSASKTLLTLKNMVTRTNHGLMGGIPSIIIPDNGIEFKNHALGYFCEKLKITIMPAQVDTPNNKPHIERFFKTFSLGLIHKLPGTTFSNPNARKNYDSEKRAVLTLDNLNDLTNDWIENVYHNRKHTGINKAPRLYWESFCEKIKPLSISEEESNILCRRPFQKSINKGRILFNGIYYYSHALRTIEIQYNLKVNCLVDETNLEKIYVQDPKDKNNFIIAESTIPNYCKNLSLEEHLESRKILKEKYNLDIRNKVAEELMLLGLFNLMNKIQEHAYKQHKFRKIKNDIPQIIENLEQKYNVICKQIDATETHEPEAKQSITDVSNNFSDIEYFCEEINLDD